MPAAEPVPLDLDGIVVLERFGLLRWLPAGQAVCVRVMYEVSKLVSQKVEPKIMTAARTARPMPRLATL